MTSPQKSKDLFSRSSTDYARFRPKYPPKLFRFLASLVDGHYLAWDVATGSGQAAVGIADYFEHVMATDLSLKQISAAEKNPKVEYRVGAAEKSTLASSSVDLITVAQAFHWIRESEFFDEVRRVLRPGGVLAIWCYESCGITPEIDALVLRFYRDVLGPYWEPERKKVEEGYKNVQLPLNEIDPPAFEMSAEWDLERLRGYLGTWSALQTCIQRTGSNPLEVLFPELLAAWGDVNHRPIRWELALRVTRKPGI